MITPVIERIMRRVDVAGPDDCWIWKGKTTNGYGQIQRTNRTADGMEYTHRLVYMQLVGPIADGMDIDHTCHSAAVRAGLCAGGPSCRHRACVNPAHLEQVTRRENVRRAGRRTCLRGHVLEPPNLIASVRGWRVCRACKQIRRGRGPDSLLRQPVNAKG